MTSSDGPFSDGSSFNIEMSGVLSSSRDLEKSDIMSTVEFIQGPGVLYSGAELPGRGDGVEGIIELRDFGGPIELKSIEISPFLRSSSFRF